MNTGMNRAGPESDEWETPPWLYQALDSEFSFTMDGAATAGNTKHRRYSSVDALLAWDNERVFCNPPYSAIEPFVRMAYSAEIAILLLPVRTDNDWFKLLVYRNAELRWLRKRVAFLMNGVVSASPRFTSLIAIIKRRV